MTATREQLDIRPEDTSIIGHFDARTFTDDGNARKFVAQYGDVVRYVHDWGLWIIWDGQRWKPDTTDQIMVFARNTASSLKDDINWGWDPKDVSTAASWARQSLNANRLVSMLKVAQSDPSVAITSDLLDAHPWPLPCTNGTVDLRTFELREPDPEDYMTRSTGIPYDPHATLSETSRQFLAEITCGDEDLELYLQKVLGYTLTGDVGRRLVFFLHGPEGQNGKSTFLSQVRYVMGDFAQVVPMAALEKQQQSKGGGAATPEIASLKGARFVTASESEQDMRLSAAKIKELVGGNNEVVYARQLYKQSTAFVPQYKLYLATNYRPNIPARDNAVWDRLRLIPFDYRVSEERLDAALGEKLQADAVAWLAWMVGGLYLLSVEGLEEPLRVMEASQTYRRDMDTFGEWLRWLEEYREDREAQGITVELRLGETHDLYQKQAKINGWDPLSGSRFAELMENAGFVRTLRHPRHWVWPKETPTPHYTLREALDLPEVKAALKKEQVGA